MLDNNLNDRGYHFIAGHRVKTDDSFISVTGQPIYRARETDVDQALTLAEEAFLSYGWSNIKLRSSFLEEIARQIDSRECELTTAAMAETGLTENRLISERKRTTNQLHQFADYIREKRHLVERHDIALPKRSPIPRPELRMKQRPLGPVVVFGASNFPLAFSVAGGDTVSALAAGCPVVFKGHPAHPITSDIVATAVTAAARKLGIPAGVFSLLQGDEPGTGKALVEHPLTRAVGFTGSLKVGRILFDLCSRRNEPIPFYGELGSVNPVFVLPNALAERGNQIAEEWVNSLTMGVGQFCTNPGVLLLPNGDNRKPFIETVIEAIKKVEPQPMLTKKIAEAYAQDTHTVLSHKNIRYGMNAFVDGVNAGPGFALYDAKTFLETPELSHEIFGPFGIIVQTQTQEEMIELSKSFTGQLTFSVQMAKNDDKFAQRLFPILERKAGRLIANQFPTGVEVCDSMVHGGPYPASTNFGQTSVGTMAIHRWMRPVCWQNIPEKLIP